MAGPDKVERCEIECPSCGAPITLRSYENAARVTCEYCDTLIDQSHEGLSIVAKFEKRQKYKPRFALGSRATFESKSWELIGFMRRDSQGFHWYEYLLFNPYHGYRFLSESDGHWNYIRPLRSVPISDKRSGHGRLSSKGRTYKHFSGYKARVSFVSGEFYWKVEVGDQVMVEDYIAPPYVISSELSLGANSAEANYSEGTYIEPAAIYRAFGKPDSSRAPQGIMANQPNSTAAAFKQNAWLALGFVTLFALISVGYFGRASGLPLATAKIPVSLAPSTPGTGASAPIMTEIFEIPVGQRNLKIEFRCPRLRQSWVYFAGVLVDIENEAQRGFQIELEYYSGPGWSEGRRQSSIILGNVSAGKHRLLLSPKTGLKEPLKSKMTASLVVRHNVARFGYAILTLIALLIIPGLSWLRYTAFESTRWADSDYGG
jgi:hypothetical protein